MRPVWFWWKAWQVPLIIYLKFFSAFSRLKWWRLVSVISHRIRKHTVWRNLYLMKIFCQHFFLINANQKSLWSLLSLITCELNIKIAFFFKYRLLFECRMNMLKKSLDESFYNANHQAIHFAVIYRKRISAGFLLSKLISISKINQQIARHIKKLNKLIPCIWAIYYSRMCNFQLFIVTT